MTGARHRRRQPHRLRPLILVLLVVLLFAVGIALGEALSDNKQESHTITQDQTFTLQPESATVTVTAP